MTPSEAAKYYRDLKSHYRDLKSKGQAELTIIFRSCPGDEAFAINDPVAEVSIATTDPATGKTSPVERRQMSAKAAERVVTVSVLDVLGIIEKAWYRLTRKPPKTYDVLVTVSPHSAWAMLYGTNTFQLTAELGSTPLIHIWLPPLGGPMLRDTLDKPRPTATNN